VYKSRLSLKVKVKGQGHQGQKKRKTAESSPMTMHSRVCAVPKGKGKEKYLYSAFLAKVVHSKHSGMDHTVLPANNTMPAFPS